MVSITVLSAQNYNRVALVIGNASYERCPLRNPLNDAEDVSAKLQSLGFEVILAKDCSTKRDMRKKLDEFCSMASNADAGVFYYSGHGMQLTSEDGNYLIPINAEMTSEADVPEECISLNYVLNKMNESGINMKIAIIDACRDNPFRTWHRGGSKGLATPGIVPNGTFIAFATSANNVAADGKDRNSPFTGAFLTALNSEELEINNVFTEVKRLVNEETNGEQRPWVSNDLIKHFYFAKIPTFQSNNKSKTADSNATIAASLKWVTIHGFVVNERNEPHDGTIVFDTTTGNDAVVQPNGRFTMRVPEGIELEFRYVGYKTKRVKAQENMVVTMELEHNPCIVDNSINSLGIKTKVININGINFTMIQVDGGTFTMGATSEQGSDFFDNEKPTHEVTLNSYMIGETEVTLDLWCAVMGKGSGQGINEPKRSVSLKDCQKFIEKMNSLTGLNFRLPTEAEWEYASRGGNKSKNFKYSGSNYLDDVAWYDGNSKGKVHIVKTKLPNELGIYDMSGNVFEICTDWYGDYSNFSQANPLGARNGSMKIMRGGGYSSEGNHCRVTTRGRFNSTGYANLGFRIVLLESPQDAIEENKKAQNEINIRTSESISTATGNTNNGHEYVDLGLPSGLLWATCNVGAIKPEDFGEYFAWGGISPQKVYSWYPSPYQKVYTDNFAETKFSKYDPDSSTTNSDLKKTILDQEDDAAHINWGGNWRMPIYEELEELKNECIWTFTTLNNVKGYKVTSRKNNKSIFLPFAGSRNDSDLDGAGEYGGYWTSTLAKTSTYCAYSLCLESNNISWEYWTRRKFGLSIRPICVPSK